MSELTSNNIRQIQAVSALAHASLKSGLTIETCSELMSKGWRYVEDNRKPARWVSPKSG